MDPEIAVMISKTLSHYFTDNTSEDSAPNTIWAAHKCVIRVEFISQAAKRSKLKKACSDELTNRIYTLERKHKSSLAAKALTELTQTREELLEELHKTLKRKYALTHKMFYEFGNKSGRLLARPLQVKKHTLSTRLKTLQATL